MYLSKEAHDKLITQLKADEGYRQFPYRCTAGKLTVGFGRNLDDVGIAKHEAAYLLEQDVAYAIEQLEELLPFITKLNEVRQTVLINMYFNIGNRLFDFKNMIGALKAGNFKIAATEMLNSKWASQVKDRATRLAQMMESGEWI